DQAAAGHTKFHAYAAVAVIVHVDNLGFARAELLHHHPDEFFRNVDGQSLDWFHELALDASSDYLRLADHQFVAFAPHHFDQDGKLEFASAHHFEGVRRAGFVDADGDIRQQFFVEPLT